MCAHQVRPYVRLVSTDDRTNETPARQYEICVSGHLGSRWTAWFDGMSLTAEDDGTTVIRGTVVDQAALHGLLHTLRDLGITLLSLNPLVHSQPVEQSDDSHDHSHDDTHDDTHSHTHHYSPGATS
jgi:hypothetical protein